MTPTKATINRTPHGQDARHVTAVRPSPDDGLTSSSRAGRTIRHSARATAAPGIAEAERQPHLASGSGRSWNFITLLVVPFPPSMWNGARVLTVAHRPLPFHPALGSSIRPSIHFV